MSEDVILIAWAVSSILVGMVTAGIARYKGCDVLGALSAGLLMLAWPFWVGALVFFSPFFLGVWVADRMRK